MSAEKETTMTKEINLDPKEWDSFRKLGHQIIEDIANYYEDIRDKPVWSEVPDGIKNQFKNSIPHSPTNPEDVYSEFKENIFPYATGNIHPRFFAWVLGNGTATGALADLLASAMNSNTGVGDHSGIYVEKQVLDWFKQMLGYPANASGLLLSGGSMANITGLLVARNSASEKIKAEGVGALPGQLTAYCSIETHNCLVKAMEVIGLGNQQLRKIPTDSNYRINVEELEEQIEQDLQEGYLPFCVIGNAGTVNTGAIDPMDDLLAVANKYDLWFHIDGAFGALAKLVPDYEVKLKALEKADSIAFDLHKWMYMPCTVGCLLVKNRNIHRQTFTSEADYLSTHERGLTASPETFPHFGMELSRRFKALKVWMSLKEHGLERYRQVIAQNIEQASFLGSLIQKNEQLELMADIPMNIVCYRFNPGNLDTSTLNRLNKELLMRMHESGVAAPSHTILKGEYVIRTNITNHRTKKEDLNKLVEASISIGNEIMKEEFLSE